jgi:hypothetical protein
VVRPAPRPEDLPADRARQHGRRLVSSFYYFTCRYTAYHFDDYGPLGIDVLVEALDPDGRVLASERRAEGSGQLFLDVIAAVPVAELSSRDYHCRSSPFVPSAPERMTSGKIACEDERNDILREYAQYEVNWIPTCGDFASGGGTAHFSWNELNGGFREGNPHSPWGIVTSRLTDGLEATRANYGAPIYLSSGYRCPHGNRRVDGDQYSLHMHGRAARHVQQRQPHVDRRGVQPAQGRGRGYSPGPIVLLRHISRSPLSRCLVDWRSRP